MAKSPKKDIAIIKSALKKLITKLQQSGKQAVLNKNECNNKNNFYKK
jgi:hypothetical protein